MLDDNMGETRGANKRQASQQKVPKSKQANDRDGYRPDKSAKSVETPKFNEKT